MITAPKPIQRVPRSVHTSRRQLCEECLTKCSAYQEGRIDHTAACVACPIQKWSTWECEPAAVTPAPSIQIPGPGTALKALFARIGLVAGAMCGCNAKAQQMDAWGWPGLWRHRRTVIGWLRESAIMFGHVRLGPRRPLVGLLGVLLIELTRETRRRPE